MFPLIAGLARLGEWRLQQLRIAILARNLKCAREKVKQETPTSVFIIKTLPCV